MIVHVEYRCPECDKVFNCPANLASHRRWHKPKNNNNNNPFLKLSASAEEDLIPSTCQACGKTFKKASTLRKHQQNRCSASSSSSLNISTESSSPSKSSSSSSSTGKSYSIEELLSPSRKSAEPPKERQLKCRICQVHFQTPRELENHCFEQCSPPPPPPPPLLTQHQQSQQQHQLISCPACPQLTFPDISLLSRHVSKFHLPALSSGNTNTRPSSFTPSQHQLPNQSSLPPPPLLSIAALASRS